MNWLSDEGLEKLKALADAATPGPWRLGWYHDKTWFDDYHTISTENGRTEVCGNYDYEEGGVVYENDAPFIAAAREAIPELIHYIQGLRK